MLSVICTKCHLCCVTNKRFALSVVVLNVMILSVIMLSVVMLNIVMLSAVMLIVVAPFLRLGDMAIKFLWDFMNTALMFVITRTLQQYL